MGQRADRHVIGTCAAKLLNPLERHSPGDLDLRAPSSTGDCFAHVGRSHVVGKNDVRTGCERLVDFCERLRFDLDAQLWILPPRAGDGCGDAAGKADVVVLDEDRTS